MPPSPTTQAAGRTAQRVGAAWEGWIEQQHEKARALGILAHVEHNNAHSKIVNGNLIFTKAGIADYTGVLWGGGQTLGVEAKSVSRDYLPKSMIEVRQAEHLTAVARAGGIALLLAEFRLDAGRPFRSAIPWLEVPWSVARSVESINSAAVEKWRIVADPAACYLSRFHKGGGPREMARKRIFHRL